MFVPRFHKNRLARVVETPAACAFPCAPARPPVRAMSSQKITIKLMTLLGNNEEFTINPNADLEAIVDHVNSKTGRPKGFRLFARHKGTSGDGPVEARKIKGMVSVLDEKNALNKPLEERHAIWEDVINANSWKLWEAADTAASLELEDGAQCLMSPPCLKSDGEWRSTFCTSEEEKVQAAIVKKYEATYKKQRKEGRFCNVL
jgi:hypothetical protein